jgi:hypothetical protein
MREHLLATQVQSASIAPQRRPLYAYWHLLSLDAPTVAALWCYAFAIASGQHLKLTIPLSLAIATWMLYVSDRLLDTRQQSRALPPDNSLPAAALRRDTLKDRHWFHAQHQPAYLAGLAAAALFLGWLLYIDMPAGLLRIEASLGALVVAYFLLIHIGATTTAKSRWKESAVAAIFATAVTLPAATSAPHPSFLLIPAALFAALCWLNCAAIEHWESNHRARHITIRQSGYLLAFIALTCASVSSVTAPRLVQNLGFPLLDLCVAVSSLSLAALDQHRHSFATLNLRVLADAVLLTPLLVLPFLH